MRKAIFMGHLSKLLHVTLVPLAAVAASSLGNCQGIAHAMLHRAATPMGPMNKFMTFLVLTEKLKAKAKTWDNVCCYSQQCICQEIQMVCSWLLIPSLFIL